MKELKDPVHEPVRIRSKNKWNPVKELKGVLQDLVRTWQVFVESGEGIERFSAAKELQLESISGIR